MNCDNVIVPLVMLVFVMIVNQFNIVVIAGEPCLKARGLWGVQDPNVFRVCDEPLNETMNWNCPAGRGFFHGLGYYGCIPFEDWPACITNAPITNVTQVCGNEHLSQPWQSQDPNKFYSCQSVEEPPKLVECGPGRGFVNATIDGKNSGRVTGCATWDKWREYMNCTNYY